MPSPETISGRPCNAAERLPEAAAPEYQAALEIEPDNGAFHVNLASVLAAAGHLDEAARTTARRPCRFSPIRPKPDMILA